jgi:hypothetical protein
MSHFNLEDVEQWLTDDGQELLEDLRELDAKRRDEEEG